MINRTITLLKKALKPFVNAMRRRSKKLLRRISDRLFFFSIRFRVGAFRHHRLVSHTLRHTLARFIGDIAYLAGDLLKKNIWRMTDSNLQIVFMGSQKSCFDVLPQFFSENTSCELIGNTSAFGLSRKTRQWFQDGCDLAIIELSRVFPFRPKAPVSFCAPHWVNQEIAYPQDMDKLLAGNRYNSLRRNINKARKAGCEWRFSRSREDFDFFYHHLYVPFTRARHAEHAHLAPYPLQWDLWIEGAGGGLVLVTQAGKTVAGAVCLVCDDDCYNIEVGVLNADESLLHMGINAFLFWSVAEWGKQQGAKFYNLGGSFGWRSNGTFNWKAKWGARVIRRKNPYRTFCIAADRTSASVAEKVNSIGFVCELRKGMYGLMLDQVDSPFNGHEIAEAVARAKKEGLDGACVASPGIDLQIYDEKSAQWPGNRPPSEKSSPALYP
jgi:hypothetical protein